MLAIVAIIIAAVVELILYFADFFKVDCFSHMLSNF